MVSFLFKTYLPIVIFINHKGILAGIRKYRTNKANKKNRLKTAHNKF